MSGSGFHTLLICRGFFGDVITALLVTEIGIVIKVIVHEGDLTTVLLRDLGANVMAQAER